jgi:hypothetical protein
MLLVVAADRGTAAVAPQSAQSRAAADSPLTLGVMDALELYALGDPQVMKLVAEPPRDRIDFRSADQGRVCVDSGERSVGAFASAPCGRDVRARSRSARDGCDE